MVDLGLLIMRIGLGIMFIYHGAPKIAGGPAKWAMLGAAMANLHVNFYPVVWGFLAAMAELLGGIFLVFGLFFEPACGALAFTMAVATLFHLQKGDGVSMASHAIELGIVFIGLMFTGPGRHRLSTKKSS